MTLGLAEGVLRWTNPALTVLGRDPIPALADPRLPLGYNADAVDRLATGDGYVSFDPELGWVPTPNFDRTHYSVRFHHNSQGVRADQEYSLQPAPGTARIDAYGDSYTYCDEVNLGDCWTPKLEQLLPGSQVLNFGVPGYAPDQAWLRYQRDGLSYHPCAVLIGDLTENINRVVNRFRPFYNPETDFTLAKPRFTLDNGALHLLPSGVTDPADLKNPSWVEAHLGPHDAWYFPGMFVPNPLDKLHLVRLARTARFTKAHYGFDWPVGWGEQVYRPGTESFDVLVEVLVEFAHQVQADGATPVVVVLPSSHEIGAFRDGKPKPHASLLTALSERGVATIDVTDALGEQARQAHISNLRDMFVANNGGHFNAASNGIVAQTLADQLPSLTAKTCAWTQSPTLPPVAQTAIDSTRP